MYLSAHLIGNAGSRGAIRAVVGMYTDAGTYTPPPALEAITSCGPNCVRTTDTAQFTNPESSVFHAASVPRTKPSSTCRANIKSALTSGSGMLAAVAAPELPAITGAAPPCWPDGAAAAGALAAEAGAVGPTGVAAAPPPGGTNGAN